MARYTIDRFEGEYAVCEDCESEEIVNILRNKIEAKAKEGDIIKLVDDKYVVDEEETKKAREEIKELMDKLWKK